MKTDTLSHRQIVRLVKRIETALDAAYGLTSSTPEELGCDLAEDFVQSAMEYCSEALGDLTRIKRSLHLERVRRRESLREWLARTHRETTRFVVTPLPVRPYSAATALILRDDQGGKERAA